MQSVSRDWGGERECSSLDRLQRCQSNRIKEGIGKNPTRGVEVLVVAAADQDGKSERETSSRRVGYGRPVDDGQDVARN